MIFDRNEQKAVVALLGAGSMGTAIVRRIGAGKKILLGDISEKALERVGEDFCRCGYDVETIRVNALQKDSVEAFAKKAAELGPVMYFIDTAHAYQNERSVGQAIKDSGIPRDSIWVTSKLWPNEYGEEVTPKQLDKMLERLGLDYIDLLLLHHTATYDEEAYQAMERGVNAGKIHSIGLSNFYEDDVDRMMRIATIKPAVLQNETHPYHQSRSVKAHIAKLGTILEAWFPLGGRGTGIKTLSQHEVITDIAQAHGKSAYQVLLRWHLQCGTIAIPGSSNAAHIAEDYDIFDFELTPDEMQRINALECNHRFASY